MRPVRIERFTLHVADRQAGFWDALERGAWEPLTLKTLAALCAPDTVFVDGGAWVGPTTLLAAACGARVIAVEADPAALDELGQNLAVNPGLGRRITVVPRALAPVPGVVRLGSRRKPGRSMSSTLHADAPANWTIDAVTPAELAAMVAPTERLVVKLDIEGGEYGLVPHLGPLVARPATAVLLSLHPAIFAEGRGGAELRTATFGVLSSFAGWSAFTALDRAWARVPVPDGADALDRAARIATDWLFLRDWPDAPPPLAAGP